MSTCRTALRCALLASAATAAFVLAGPAWAQDGNGMTRTDTYGSIPDPTDQTQNDDGSTKSGAYGSIPGGTPTSAKTTPPTANSSQRSNYTGILDISDQASDPRAPAWLIIPRIELTEVATDNIQRSNSDKKADLVSELSAGAIVSTDTPYLSAYTNFLGTYSKHLNQTDQDDLTGSLYSTAHATFIPDYLFMDLHGTIADVSRDFSGTPLPALTPREDNLQTYIVSASPYFASQLGSLGYTQIRYLGSWAWFSGRTVANPPPGSVTGPISNSAQHQVRGDFVFPGSLVRRLFSDISLSGQYADTAGTIGIFRRNFAQLINEYQITRSFSIIGAGGYEEYSDHRFPLLHADEAIWSGGVRWRPNADSSLVLTYGRYDGATDFAGEALFRVTPFTVIYAAYTDSITTSQQALTSNSAESAIQTGGESALLTQPEAVTGVTYEQNPIISLIDKAFVSDTDATSEFDELNVAAGVPLSSADNFYPLEDDITRVKSLRGIIYRDIDGNILTLEGYHYIQTSLLTAGAHPQKTTGAVINYGMPLSAYVALTANAGYRRADLTNSDIYHGGLGMLYAFSPGVAGRLAYDIVKTQSSGSSSSYTQNAVTLSIQASF